MVVVVAMVLVVVVVAVIVIAIVIYVICITYQSMCHGPWLAELTSWLTELSLSLLSSSCEIMTNYDMPFK